MFSPSTSIPTGPITLAEVRAAVGDTDPNATNAGALRKIMWNRGSYATIQKHLDTIRRERAPAPPLAPGTAPAAPAEAVGLLWNAAYSAVQAHVLARLESVTSERDRLTAALATTQDDLAAMAADVDALTDAASSAKAASDAATEALAKATAEAAEALAAEQASAAKAATAAASHVTNLESIIERIGAAANHQAEMAKRDAQLTAQSMQSTIDRLTDQVGELKSLLHASRA